MKPLRVVQNIIQSRNHEITTIQQQKIALSAYDNKRWILDDGIHTLAHGHFHTISRE